MKTTHSFGIDFLIRRCKENKKRALIYARITVDEERKEVSLKEQIDAGDWNPHKEIVKGKTEQVKSLNQHIEDVRFKIKEKYRALCDKEALVTAEIVKQAYLGAHTMLKGHKLFELLDYYHKIWKPKLKEGGFKNVETTIEYVKRSIASEYPAGDIYLSQLSMELATNFEHYVRSHPIKAHDPCGGNGLAKHIQRFKRIVNWAVEIKWILVNPFKEYTCPQKKHKRKKLTFQQQVSVEQQYFPDPTVSYVRDLFVVIVEDFFEHNHIKQFCDEHIWPHIRRRTDSGIPPAAHYFGPDHVSGRSLSSFSRNLSHRGVASASVRDRFLPWHDHPVPFPDL